MAFTLPDEILARLSSQAVGSTNASSSGWLLVTRQFLPGTIGQSTRAQQIAVVPTGGHAWEPTENLDRPTFQVLVRGAYSPNQSSTGLEQKITDVVTALCSSALIGFTIKSRRYIDVQKQGEMLFLGRDDNNRPIYGQNFLAWRSRST